MYGFALMVYLLVRFFGLDTVYVNASLWSRLVGWRDRHTGWPWWLATRWFLSASTDQFEEDLANAEKLRTTWPGRWLSDCVLTPLAWAARQ